METLKNPVGPLQNCFTALLRKGGMRINYLDVNVLFWVASFANMSRNFALVSDSCCILVDYHERGLLRVP